MLIDLKDGYVILDVNHFLYLLTPNYEQFLFKKPILDYEFSLSILIYLHSYIEEKGIRVAVKRGNQQAFI